MSYDSHQHSITATLLDRLPEQNPADWKRLLALFTPVVYHWARRGGLQDSDAADVVQEVFAAVHLGVTRFRNDSAKPSFRGWIYGITRNKIHDIYRKTDRWPHGEGGSAALQRLHDVPQKPVPEEDVEATTARLTRRGLEIIQGDFESATWNAFHALAVQGRPAADVAAELGISVGSVYVAKSRVLKRLREELDGLL